MAVNEKRRNIKYKSFININAGIVIFGLILIYMFVNIVIYFTTERTKFYEVTAGSNEAKINNSYEGIAIRDEVIKYAKSSGYVDYFIREGSRISKNSTLYSIDSSGDLSNLLLSASKENSKLTDENLNTIKDIIYDFTNNFDNMNFSDLYSFKSTIRGTVVDLINMNSLEKLAKDNGESFSINKAEVSGIVLYRVDDFETIKPKKLKNSDYDKSEYIAALFSSGDKITKGAPIYKAINDDEWSIALKFNKKDVKKYKDTTNIVIKFLKDGLSTTANLKIVKGADGNSYGVVTLSKYVVRYATDRFLDVEIVETPKKGLKVPKSSVTSKSLYVIPKEYGTMGENGTSIGFYMQNSSRSKNESEIYYPPITMTDDKNYYVSKAYFKPGDVITKENSHANYAIGKTRKFMGVYNINNGYTVFEVVTILDSVDEYHIVKIEDNGLSPYDRIVLDASKVSENQIIFQ